MPESGVWEEILNTDAEIFGGFGVGNFGKVMADGPQDHSQPHSAKVSVPPLGGIWLRPKKASG